MVESVAVVIPCFRVKRHILGVLSLIPEMVHRVYVVDDACPEATGSYVENSSSDSRVVVLRHSTNQGVGGAVLTGYQAAIKDGYDVIVKVDGDGQMDPTLIPFFVNPIVNGEADYTKGNRFFDLEEIRSMPFIRIFGNAVLSFMTKFSSGYWNLFDPTNGYTAIHADAVRHLPLKKISKRYFFETDMLFRLNLIRAVVQDVALDAKYGDEVSNLKISKIIFEFLFKHIRNGSKRLFYSYYLRDLSVASFELPIGLLMLCFGLVFGSYQWISSSIDGVSTPAGTVMLAAMPLLMGVQLVLAFLAYDINSVPRKSMHAKKI